MMVLNLVVPPALSIGMVAGSARRVATVASGSFDSSLEHLGAGVCRGGVDWISEDAQGTVSLDARVVLETNAGAAILMSYRGVRHTSKAVAARLANGDDVDPAEYYFRTSPRFETAAPELEWLNNCLYIGLGHKRPDGVAYSVFEVL